MLCAWAHMKSFLSFHYISGVPLPVLVWYKDAVPIHKLLNPRYKVLLNGSLQIQGLQPDDSGIFQCFARNDAGETQSRTFLDVTSMSGPMWGLSRGGRGRFVGHNAFIFLRQPSGTE